MDSQDREFEALLKTFQLRSPAPFPAETREPAREPARLWWAVPVVAAVVAIAIGAFWFSSFLGTLATVEVAGDSSYRAGDRVALRTPIESGSRESFVWSLDDGSRVEMRAQSSVSLESHDDGLRLRLNKGSVLVSGTVQVVTSDALVAVTGKTSFIELQPGGTRVGAIDGEVDVRSGTYMKKLHQGEQFSTASTETMTPLTEAIAWSRRATELVALLPSPPAATPEAPVVAYTPAPSPRRLSRTVVIPPPEQAQEAPQPAPTQPTPEPTPEPTPAPTPEPTAAPQPSPGGAPAPVPGPEGPPSLRRPVPDLGAQIAARECGGCHVPEMGQQAYTNRAAVEAVVSRMTSYGARVSQSEFPVLVDYLLRTYNGPARPAR